jgi:hypothetical protein
MRKDYWFIKLARSLGRESIDRGIFVMETPPDSPSLANLSGLSVHIQPGHGDGHHPPVSRSSTDSLPSSSSIHSVPFQS